MGQPCWEPTGSKGGGRIQLQVGLWGQIQNCLYWHSTMCAWCIMRESLGLHTLSKHVLFMTPVSLGEWWLQRIHGVSCSEHLQCVRCTFVARGAEGDTLLSCLQKLSVASFQVWQIFLHNVNKTAKFKADATVIIFLKWRKVEVL